MGPARALTDPMTPDLWQRLKPLLLTAPGDDPAGRAQLIEDTCADHPDLKVRLAALALAEEGRSQSLPSLAADMPGRIEDSTVRFQPDEVVLNRFRIVRSIGAGGMGEVYEAVDLQLGTIALKTIRQDVASSREAFERFRQEVQLARRVSGPQVCRIHELFLLPASGGHSQTAFLTMEFLDGVTLASRLRDRGPLSRKQALPLALEICEGLRLIHEKGIIHRDLKSGNIMVCEQNGSMRTVVMDFGLAHDFSIYASSGDSTATRVPFRTNTGAVVGTPAYMAPEQFEPGAAVSPATDIYALGIVLYELLNGIHPYSAHSPMGAAIRRARYLKPPSSVRRGVPRHWDRIIERCLEFEPEKRFQSAAEVAKALRSGPANLTNLKQDRPWILWVAGALIVGILAWPVNVWWQARQQYHPSADAFRWYDTGVVALREGDYVKATRSLQQATTVDSHYVMAHARLAEAWENLDFDGNAQRELLVATSGEQHLRPLDRMYFEAIRAMVTRDSATEIATYQQILGRLPADQKASGHVDLGMAYERAGDPTHALQNYVQATSLDSNNPAPFMRTAILQSRLRHVPEADQAFQQAQKLLALEMDFEGQADLDYERGYAANDGTDPRTAERYLNKALEEAKALPSVQLQIRALTQLSTVAYASGHYDDAVKDAQDAIHLAQSNDLNVWAANGYVRLANAELQQENLDKAEGAILEALQISSQNQQSRTQAAANLTLASIKEQRNLPDQVIAPAQSALAYYTQNGFFGLAVRVTVILSRAQREKEQYSQALASARASQDLAVKSGNHPLMVLADEAVGSVYLWMEQYSNALGQFQKALSESDSTTMPNEDIYCANTLWRLGRYTESDQMLQSVPHTPKLDERVNQVRVASLLSRLAYNNVDSLAQKMLATESTLDADSREELELEAALAESHLQKKPAAQKRIETLQQVENTPDGWQNQIRMAEVELSLGMNQAAFDGARKTVNHFAATGELESELRSLYIGASAAKAIKDSATDQQFSMKAVDILSQLQHTWEPQALKLYLSRPDLQALARAEGSSAPFDRR